MSRTRRVRLPAGEGTGPQVDADDLVAVEEPLELRVEGKATAVTMRTPGDDLDLAVGFLATEGVLDAEDPMADLRAIAQISENVVDVRLADGVSASRARSADREFFATSSCGICGKASIDRIVRGRPEARPGRRAPATAPATPLAVSDALLAALPAAFDAAQRDTHATGGVHAAALFDLRAPTARIVLCREDVGRHNAVDKVIGAWLRAEPAPDGPAFADLGLVVTSRAGFEVVQKAVSVGIGVVCVVGAPTSLAIELAEECGCQLIGWVREGRSRRYVAAHH